MIQMSGVSECRWVMEKNGKHSRYMNHNSPYSIYRYKIETRDKRRKYKRYVFSQLLVVNTVMDDLATPLALDLPVKETTGDADREPDNSSQHTYLGEITTSTG